MMKENLMLSEITDTAKKVIEIQRAAVGGDVTLEEQNGPTNLLTCCLLTDSHYTEDGTWEDTADNIRRTLATIEREKPAEMIGGAIVEGIIHLGDFTDGMAPKKVTMGYVNRMLSDLRRNHLPVYITPGNHDYNFVKGNKERFSKEELLQLLGLEKEYYYKDFEKQKLRLLFLDSYNPDTPVRYGFSPQEMEWVKETLGSTPKGYKVVVFAHAIPLDNLDYWARLIRNGKLLMTILEEYNARKDCQILAYIHGHTHGEHVYRGSSFPIISIGSNKRECKPEIMPPGAHVYERERGDVSQDLWDILLIDGEAQKLHFVRFGAGEDRVVDCHKSESTWRMEREEKRRERTMKIWAHRGASGFAPENTLPAFEVAKELDVDGVELDVHMTKDGELVVIHDERIDRTSDGEGFVKDYTLSELRRYNFAKNKPLFGFTQIPTLREVYELFRDTDYVINVELKTDHFAYEGIEERVHNLTVEMGMTKQVIYSSFNHESVLKIQQFVTEEKTAFLVGDVLDVVADREADVVDRNVELVEGFVALTDCTGYLVDYAAKHKVHAIHPSADYPDLKGVVEACHKKGIKVNVWTVNEEEQALWLKEMGVDAIITNHPGKMRELFDV